MTSQDLKFERHVLGDMAQPSAIVQASCKAARVAIAAAMPGQARKVVQQPLYKPGKSVARIGFKRPEVDLDADHREATEEIGTPIDAGLTDRHRRPAAGLNGGLRHIGVERRLSFASGRWNVVWHVAPSSVRPERECRTEVPRFAPQLQKIVYRQSLTSEFRLSGTRTLITLVGPVRLRASHTQRAAQKGAENSVAQDSARRDGPRVRRGLVAYACRAGVSGQTAGPTTDPEPIDRSTSIRGTPGPRPGLDCSRPGPKLGSGRRGTQGLAIAAASIWRS